MPKVKRTRPFESVLDMTGKLRMRAIDKLHPEERFLYWIYERHNVHLRRHEWDVPKPWTDDLVLQENFFTNPYRENDRVTVWFRNHIREILRNTDDVMFATVAFRWFNKPDPTGLLMKKHDLHMNWRNEFAKKVFKKAWKNGKQAMFTGAYMIKAGNGERGCKIPNVCDAINNIWKDRYNINTIIHDENTLQAAVETLSQYPYLGKFMSYEVACDLRYTYMLEAATDIHSWTNFGPGATRGLSRIRGTFNIKDMPASGMKDFRPKTKEGDIEEARRLKDLVNERIVDTYEGFHEFEMREVEHSLCEYDKYERILRSEGRSKRKYNGIKT